MFTKLVSNCACPLVGAEQVVYSGFFRAFSLKTAACCDWKRRHESGESEPEQ